MEKEEIKNKLIEYTKNKKTKTVTLSEIYTSLKIPYNPMYDKLINQVLTELQQENKIQPLKTSKQNRQGSYEKYRIIQKKSLEEKNIKEEILNTLVQKMNIGYFLKHPEEYIKNREMILSINQFMKNPDRHMLTVNERSYQLFRDEKKLKQNEEILNKLGLKYADIYAYDTYEPFFCYVNKNFKGSYKKILIIENKDTFWTMRKVVQSLMNPSDIYMIIYGEGKKILKSFPYIEDFDISEQDIIQYFGDIDYEGINIYMSLKERYSNFNISIYKEGYETILDIEQEPENIRTKQNKNNRYMQEFLTEFEEKYQEKLWNIFENKKYIPQEVFNYEVAKKKVK